MPPKSEPGFEEPLVPAGARADGRGVGEQAVLFLLGEPGELLAQGMIGMEEGFLAIDPGGSPVPLRRRD
jgi:hypothetical protein